MVSPPNPPKRDGRMTNSPPRGPAEMGMNAAGLANDAATGNWEIRKPWGWLAGEIRNGRRARASYDLVSKRIPRSATRLTSGVASSTKQNPQLLLVSRSTILTTLTMAVSASLSLPTFPTSRAISWLKRLITSSPVE